MSIDADLRQVETLSRLAVAVALLREAQSVLARDKGEGGFLGPNGFPPDEETESKLWLMLQRELAARIDAFLGSVR